MAGYTDRAFRLCVRELGGLGLAFTEMLNPGSLLRGGGRRKRTLLATSPEDRPLGYQIYGKDPALLADAARWVQDRGADLVDVNMGCPQKRIVGQGVGAALLKTPGRAVEIVRQIRKAVTIPFTAKMRLGWDNAGTAAELARAFEAEGVDAVTVHGRTRAQGYGGRSDIEAIRGVAQSVARIPVIANGDIVSVETARDVFARTGCGGIMLGRHPIKEPWIIRDIARDLLGRLPLAPPTRAEHLSFALRHLDRCVDLYGERIAVVQFRKWNPQYLKGLAVDRATLVRLQRIADLEALKAGLAEVFLGRK